MCRFSIPSLDATDFWYWYRDQESIAFSNTRQVSKDRAIKKFALIRYTVLILISCDSWECSSWPSRGQRSTCSSPSWAGPWVPWVTWPLCCALSSSSLPSWACSYSARTMSVSDKYVSHYSNLSLDNFSTVPSRRV